MELYCNKPLDEVTVKMSICLVCYGTIRVAVEHMMNKKSTNEFGAEVIKYNLSVKTVSLIEYRETKPEWCKCNN